MFEYMGAGRGGWGAGEGGEEQQRCLRSGTAPWEGGKGRLEREAPCFSAGTCMS